MLHVGTNDAANSSRSQIKNYLLALKEFTREKLQNCNIILSMPVKRCGNQKPPATVNLVNEQLSQMNIKIIENKNISDRHLKPNQAARGINDHSWYTLLYNFLVTHANFIKYGDFS